MYFFNFPCISNLFFPHDSILNLDQKKSKFLMQKRPDSQGNEVGVCSNCYRPDMWHRRTRVVTRPWLFFGKKHLNGRGHGEGFGLVLCVCVCFFLGGEGGKMIFFWGGPLKGPEMLKSLKKGWRWFLSTKAERFELFLLGCVWKHHYVAVFFWGVCSFSGPSLWRRNDELRGFFFS